VNGQAPIEAEDRDGARVIRVRGEIDLFNAAEVMNAIAAAVPNDASLVVLDLSDTAYLDSAGISMLFQLAARLRYSRRELRLVVPTEAPIRRMVELTNVNSVAPIDDVWPSQ
jgi:anti-sigma B factor antagonist